MADLVYLHGFASGPGGNKARHCRLWAERQGVAFHAPDLNLPDFEHLTITAQVEAVAGLIGGLDAPPVVVGSSLGGLVAAALTHTGAPVQKLILLAPAFGFARRRLAGPRWAGYRRRGTIPVFHHARNEWLTLGPDLLRDLDAWRRDEDWAVAVPVTILHGTRDESVPIAESRGFVARHPGCTLIEVEDDHALLKPATLERLDRTLAEAFGVPPPTSRG